MQSMLKWRLSHRYPRSIKHALLYICHARTIPLHCSATGTSMTHGLLCRVRITRASSCDNTDLQDDARRLQVHVLV